MSGFSSTLSRLLGRKEKAEKTTPNGKLSKSSTNLSLAISTTDINETSQLEYNRITPLPAVTSNAPFEQTFRITVLLPKDQLYVTRLGARVPLSKLLQLVCENKLLDSSKYEFRNPVDPSQVFNCDLTIGAVGLSELRMCHKTDNYDNYNTDEVIKLKRGSANRESVSSSELSSRNSKHTTKTTSPYSSNNSLNSMDSAGVNYIRTPVSPPPPSLPTSAPPKMAAPPRKKRAAPRPPQPIPEKTPLIIEAMTPHGDSQSPAWVTQENGNEITTMPRKNHHVSTPNLSSPVSITSVEVDMVDSSELDQRNGNVIANGQMEDAEDETLRTQVEQRNSRNLYPGSMQNLTFGHAHEEQRKLPEPTPRKRVLPPKKKSAPAPPPRRDSASGEDSTSHKSLNLSTPNTPDSPVSLVSSVEPTRVLLNQTEPPKVDEVTPAPMPVQASTPVLQRQSSTDLDNKEPFSESESPPQPQPLPRVTTTNSTSAVSTTENSETSTTGSSMTSFTSVTSIRHQTNVSKVLLNRTPTPEPRSLSTEPSDMEMPYDSHMSAHNGLDDDDNLSKQADSGIGEPVPSPIPDSLPSEGSVQDSKSPIESSSDDDEHVKVYNFKLGKTLSTPIEDLSALPGESTTESGETTPGTVTNEPTPAISQATSWNFSIPISPPPHFADVSKKDQVPDKPITPKIKQRPVLDFGAMESQQIQVKNTQEVPKKTQLDIELNRHLAALPSPTTPLNEIVDELSAIINDKRMDSLIKRPEELNEIESAKPNTLTNFSISTILQHQVTKPTEILQTNGTPATVAAPTEEDSHLYRKRSSITSLKQRRSITRADSFHAMATNLANNGVEVERSSSHLSLTKIEQGINLSRRRSSSELSIGESPHLQSLEVIKTILNSRKNSLASGSDGESKTSGPDSVEQQETTIEETKVSYAELRPKKEESAAAETPKEEPKKYRYTGPPSINFSTWNERPKVQVAIKNEGDYIFGGKNAGSQNAAVTTAEVEIQSNTIPRNYRASMPNNIKSGYSLPPPVAQKPLLSTTLRMGIPEKEYRVPITVKPLHDHVVTGDVESNSKVQVSTLSTNSFTLPRNGEKRLNRTKDAGESVPGPAILRTTSVTKADTNVKSTPSVAPFGQNTLRKTGLKEKILAKEEADHAKGEMNLSNGIDSAPVNKPKLQSAKLELKQKHTSSVFLTHTSVTMTPAPVKLQRPQSVPVAPPVPAGGLPFLRSTAGKASRSPTTPTTNGEDPRNEMLAAIRNFKREDLNRT